MLHCKGKIKLYHLYMYICTTFRFTSIFYNRSCKLVQFKKNTWGLCNEQSKVMSLCSEPHTMKLKEGV